MGANDAEFDAAGRWIDAMRAEGYAVSAAYDAARGRIRVVLQTGEALCVDPSLTRGLCAAAPDDLAEIEISRSGLELLWPRLDTGMTVSAIREYASRTRAPADTHLPSRATWRH